jgi:hypothetical protein
MRCAGREGGPLGILGIDERIILKWILNQSVRDVDWNKFSEDMDR